MITTTNSKNLHTTHVHFALSVDQCINTKDSLTLFKGLFSETTSRLKVQERKEIYIFTESIGRWLVRTK